MRKYLELFERSESPNVEVTDFIRIDVTDYNQEDFEEARNLLKELADSSYEHFVIQLHFCYHDVGGACRVETIYER